MTEVALKMFRSGEEEDTHFFLARSFEQISDLARKKVTHCRCLRICEMAGIGLPLGTS